MNFVRLFQGCIKALGLAHDGQDNFDFSNQGVIQSFVALFLSVPFYFVCATAIVTQRNRAVEATIDPDMAPLVLPTIPFVTILIVYSLMFPLVSYILCQVFHKQELWKPWIVVRHWSFFFLSAFAAFLFGGYLVGWIPFATAVTVVFLLYLATLAIDIRLAQKLAGFDWGAAILSGCIITATGLMVILVGVDQFVS